MVDACMRALTSTGWLNFRMRAMLMSFSSYHLWLHWREPALHLARLFLDYEPGIHWSQCQMQSGTTGINAIRIYNPVKQCLEQDPKGDFIRKWLPELSACSNAELHRPFLASEKYIDYPEPIVNEKMARLKAADAIYRLKKGKNYSEIASQIVRKHASRKPSAKFLKSRKKGIRIRVQRSQLELSFPSESPDEPSQK